MTCGSGFKIVPGTPTDDTYWACGSEQMLRLQATVKGARMKAASAALDWNIESQRALSDLWCGI